MKNTVNKRFTQLVNLLKETKNSFARNLGVESTQIYNICLNEKGEFRNAPSHMMYEAIANAYPEVNLHWLITGKGLPFMKTNDLTGHDLKELKELLETVDLTMDKLKTIQAQLSKLVKQK